MAVRWLLRVLIETAIKARIYAQVGVIDYWVVDLTNRRVVVHRKPDGDHYAAVESHERGVLRPLRHPATAIDVASLFS